MPARNSAEADALRHARTFAFPADGPFVSPRRVPAGWLRRGRLGSEHEISRLSRRSERRRAGSFHSAGAIRSARFRRRFLPRRIHRRGDQGALAGGEKGCGDARTHHGQAGSQPGSAPIPRDGRSRPPRQDRRPRRRRPPRDPPASLLRGRPLARRDRGARRPMQHRRNRSASRTVRDPAHGAARSDQVARLAFRGRRRFRCERRPRKGARHSRRRPLDRDHRDPSPRRSPVLVER